MNQVINQWKNKVNRQYMILNGVQNEKKSKQIQMIEKTINVQIKMMFESKKYICPNQIKKGLVGVKDSIIYIKNNFSIALMIDQRVSEGKNLPFFEHMALTTTMPAQIALKFGRTVLTLL